MSVALSCAVLCLLQVHMLSLRLQVLLQALLRCAHRDALPEVHGMSLQHDRLVSIFLPHPLLPVMVFSRFTQGAYRLKAPEVFSYLPWLCLRT